jgi:protein arginine N-methyltransferase 5
VLKVFTCQRSFEAPYRDVLQAPLQPLADNLESGVYEVFERDPVKYKQYEEAVAQALTDRFTHNNIADPAAMQRTAEVLVVGAGRGPLIRCVLAASARTGVPVRVHALEKNPNAVLTLRSLQRHDPAFRDVHIVATDARDWEGPTALAAATPTAGDGAPPSRSGHGFADILVSELLGSFGDNELSPECLEGVCAKFLVPATGISIPQSSSSYLVPVSSSRLWSDVLAQGNEIKSMETSYVCALHNYYRASNVIKPVFKFVHRAPPATEGTAAAAAEEQTEGDWSDDENEEVVAAERVRREAFKASSAAAAAANGIAATAHAAASGLPADSSVPPVCHSRHTRLSFPIPLSCTVHGLAGFFSSRLYKSVYLSIIPGARFSTGMFSWFPLFFPLRTPVGVRAGQTIEVDLWRATTDRKVWYEWAVAAPQTTPIHNPNGRSSYIGL